MSSKNAITVSLSSLRRHQMQQHPAAFNRVAPRRQNRLALGTGPQTLGNAVNEQISDLVLTKVAPRASPGNKSTPK
jgi:hypothetical protein